MHRVVCVCVQTILKGSIGDVAYDWVGLPPMGADKCIFYFGQIYTNTSIGCQWLEVLLLGDPTFANRAFLFNIAQTSSPTPLIKPTWETSRH